MTTRRFSYLGSSSLNVTALMIVFTCLKRAKTNLTNKHLYKLIYQLQEVTYQQSNIAPCENPEVSKLALVIG